MNANAAVYDSLPMSKRLRIRLAERYVNAQKFTKAQPGNELYTLIPDEPPYTACPGFIFGRIVHYYAVIAVLEKVNELVEGLQSH